MATESACLSDVEFVGPASARHSQQSLERHGVCGHAAQLLYEVCLELHIVLKQAQVTRGGEQALGGGMAGTDVGAGWRRRCSLP